MKKIVILGKSGSFHEEAAREYFEEDIEIISVDSFALLSEQLENNLEIDHGVMAIENSIAGTILQNYKILREKYFTIVGEKYLPIHHNLLVTPGTQLDQIEEIISHPMALNQCQNFTSKLLGIKLTESKDTVEAAKIISKCKNQSQAAIASRLAADIYKLEVLEENIESEKINFTRFLIINRDNKFLTNPMCDKASIYLRTNHEKGSLLHVLEKIYAEQINISKLQSYPVPGEFNKYFFHLDLEFESLEQMERLIPKLEKATQKLKILGVYKRDK